jgi:hypothetical protein
MKSEIMNSITHSEGVCHDTKKEVQEQACRLEQGQNDWPEVAVESETNPFHSHSPEVGSADAGIGTV